MASRVTYLDTSIPIDSAHVGYPTAPVPFASATVSRSSAASQAFNLQLKAEVAPPSIGGQVLQATSVSIVGNLAVVSYNMVGNPYLGGVDVIDISNKNHPVLTSEALFQNTDVSAVTTSGVNVYLAEATGDTGFAAPAVFEVVKLVGNQLVLTGNTRTGLSSFAATSVAYGTSVYATSGDAGSLFVIDPTLFTVTSSIALHDARWVAAGGGQVAVVQGTPGTLDVYSESNMSVVGSWPFKGADIAQSKSQLELVGGKAFIAAGDSGVQVLSASTGAVVGSVPRPNPDSLGLSPSVVVTNAVAIDQDLMFISNGEAGVYLAQGSQAFSTTGSETQQTITMRGKLRFGNLQSVNHVALQSGLLIIAAGLGGLKIVQVN
ncbi:MAG: hypothetical protein DMD38_07410 [Gemmatimonadetes bacterium]|nr:MAG: hypothetical protein AUI86_07930 [Gemmatimonadetes bacterium 13_1_40CM_3_66_12]OLD89020.1 MAG: hypothetical protein AUG85_02905 [Gemmatimonadetes bacterium 13_1_20CM_4_66_11]PYP96954.1 MAG: hypothetical protein DMD38_07410 [Gemmatimonadota bacterium]